MQLFICPEPQCEGHKDPLKALLQGQHHLDNRMEQLMGALDNLKTADTDLRNEVATFLLDIAGRLGNPDADVQAVADDINAEVTALKGGDPANTPVATDPTTPVDGVPVDGDTTTPVAG